MRIRSMTMVAVLAAGAWLVSCTPGTRIDEMATISGDAAPDAVILVRGLT